MRFPLTSLTVVASLLFNAETALGYSEKSSGFDDLIRSSGSLKASSHFFETRSTCSGASEVAKDVLFGYWTGTKTSANKTKALAAISSLKSSLSKYPNQESFEYTDGNLIGYMWVGSMVQNTGFSAGDAMTLFYNEVTKNGIPNMIYMEYVNGNPMQSFGITLNTGGSAKLGDTQKAVKLWSEGQAYNTYTGTKSWKSQGVCYLDYAKRKTTTNDENAGECYYFRVKSGETAADTSGVDGESLQAYNPSVSFSSLYVDQPLCKSVGTLKDFSPKKSSNGTCYAYLVKSGDSCASIAARYPPLTVSKLESYNTETYGWNGCSSLAANTYMCLSSGTPHDPVPDPNAECGPLAAGDLHNAECPLNACCSQYGYCGTTSDYCDVTTSTTGNPGTEGCYSNCGYGKLHTSQAKTFRNIVYWRDTDGDLASNPKELDNGNYDTIHYAFVSINSDFSIDSSSMSNTDFFSVSMKKVASFGGYSFSTGSSTYQIFRNIVSSASNRETFATNVVAFLTSKGLDGIDLDWEYPGEQDIDGIPADSTSSGANYLELIKTIKSKLPSGKTLSVAIPSTYYHLQNFPVSDIQSYVDYIVLMAYDYVTEGELQCHTNLELIEDSLLMLDKAEVKMWKLTGGIATYGISYKLADTSCTTIGCKSNGNGASRSGTNTPGILADYEINTIASSSAKVLRKTDSNANCDIMVYDKNSWVAWPKLGQRTTLQTYYKEHALGGTVTWAGNYLSHKSYD